MNETWQENYAREFEWTNGYTVAFEARGGGWFRMLHPDHGGCYHRAVRRKEVEQMTRNLRTRRDFDPSEADDAF